MIAMSPQQRKSAWFWIPLRVLLVTFLLTLVAFALSLLLGILGLWAGAALRGVTPNLTLAYHQIAPPAAAIVGAIVFVSSIFLEVRHYRRNRVLDGIARASR